MTPSGSSRLDRLAFIVFQITLFLTPVFFIPSASVPVQVGKAALILYGITITLILWLIARLKDGVFSAPKTILCCATGVFALGYTLAALFSANHMVSIAGQGFELGSLAFFLPSLVLLALVPVITRTEKQIFYSYATLLASFLVAALFYVIRFIGGSGVLSFGIFTSLTSNFVGQWNDLAIFFGLGAMLSLIALERATLSRLFKTLVYIAFILSLAMLVVVGFTSVWVALAVLSLVFFIYELSFGRTANVGSRIPYHALIVLIVSVIFMFFGSGITSLVSNSLGTSQVEVRPSWAATYDVSIAAVKDHPVFGAGPDRFVSEWLAHKPAGVNGTIFWNTDFDYGIGFLPSLLATTGIVGFLAMLFFIGAFAWIAVKALLREGSSPFSRYLVLSSLFASVYLWIFAIVYVPSDAIWILTVALTGLLIASLREDKAIALRERSVVGRPAASFVAVLLGVIALICAISFGYFVTLKLVANVYYQKGIETLNSTGDLDKGQQDIAAAIALSPVDVYYQSLSQVLLARLNNLSNSTSTNQSALQTQFQSYLSSAIQAAQQAVALDPTNYQNYLQLGQVFEAVVPLNIQGAFDNAQKEYQQALSLNPNDPEIYLVLARLSVADKDAASAKDYINKALQLKSDYADAIYLLSQIQIAENDVPNAIKSVSAVATLSPSDPGIFFQLGLLYYDQKDYQNAVLALERAVSLEPQYANAEYFLGLSYYLTGAPDKALQEFQDLAKTNPNNSTVEQAIANLQAGKSPVPPAAAQSATTQSAAPVKQ